MLGKFKMKCSSSFPGFFLFCFVRTGLVYTKNNNFKWWINDDTFHQCDVYLIYIFINFIPRQYLKNEFEQIYT